MDVRRCFFKVHTGPQVRPLADPRTSSGRCPYVDGPRLARVVQQKRLRSIAVICPAFVRGTVAAGPDGVRGSGPKHGGGVEDTNRHHGLSRSSDRPITILLLSLQAPECGERFRPPAGGGRSPRSPAWPRRCGPSCWPAPPPRPFPVARQQLQKPGRVGAAHSLRFDAPLDLPDDGGCAEHQRLA